MAHRKPAYSQPPNTEFGAPPSENTIKPVIIQDVVEWYLVSTVYSIMKLHHKLQADRLNSSPVCAGCSITDKMGKHILFEKPNLFFQLTPILHTQMVRNLALFLALWQKHD